MADWNSLTNDEKMARLANLEVAQEVNDADADANLPIAEIVPLEPVAAAALAAPVAAAPAAPAAAPAAPVAAVPYQSRSRNAASGPRSKTPDPEEVERYNREWERKLQREKLEEKRWREKIKERKERKRLSLKAAEPGKSLGYIDSQLKERYHIHDRVIVLFTGDDPPKWYKGTIDLKRRPQHPWYYVVFDDGDERWIEYKNNNIRYFGVKKKKKVEGLVPGQRVRNNVTKFKGIILEGANRSNMIKVKVMRPDNSHFIQYWSKSVTAISPWRGGGTQRKTKRKRRKSRRKSRKRRKSRRRKRKRKKTKKRRR
jgi:hypothetical protein